jgi:hypothetical protein
VERKVCSCCLRNGGETIYVGIRRIGNVEINGTVSQNGSGTDDVNEVFSPRKTSCTLEGRGERGRKGDAACEDERAVD